MGLTKGRGYDILYIVTLYHTKIQKVTEIRDFSRKALSPRKFSTGISFWREERTEGETGMSGEIKYEGGKRMKYRIGLDIGVASVGGCAMECDENGEPVRILDLCVRTFDAAEGEKGAPPAQPRREARGLRRRLRRRAHRLERVRALCAEAFGEDVLGRAEQNGEDLFRLRCAGLDEKLRDEELVRVLVHLAGHRGFRSNRKSESKDKETGELLKAIAENGEYMQAHGYRTVGEMFYRDPKYFEERAGRRVYTTRNRDGEYSRAFSRADIEKEARAILSRQEACGLVDGAFSEKYIEILLSQRSFDEGPAAPSPYRTEGYDVGDCPFEKGEKRASKAGFTAEYLAALQKINHLKIFLPSGEERFLSAAEREKLYAAAREKKEMNFAQVKKSLGLPEETSFNLVNYSARANVSPSDTEKKTKLFRMERSYELRAALDEKNRKNIPLLDEAANVLSLYKSDDRRMKAFSESGICAALSEEEKSRLLGLDFSGFARLSYKAMNKLLPRLEEGLKYNEACEAAGYDFRAHDAPGDGKLSRLRGEEVRGYIEDIGVPVVRRALAQSVKVLNALLDKYGQPCGVNIELARELSKNSEERGRIARDNQKREEEFRAALEKLRTEFHLTAPKGTDVLKYRLYEEQGGKCAYSQKAIDSARLFESNYVQIDHVLPYSRSFDDGYNNKVLVLSAENQHKKDRTPFEYFGADEERWGAFEAFVQTTYKNNRKKRENLLRRNFSEESAKDWKDRSLNDTRYICRAMYNLIADYLRMDPVAGRKKQVRAVNGRITAYLRNFWGLKKIRGAGDKHHAQDAAVIACVTDGTIARVTKYNKLKEKRAVWDQDARRYLYADSDGVLLDADEYDSRSGLIKEPYRGFTDELRLRLSEDPKAYLPAKLLFLDGLGYTDQEIDGLSPVFVSRMPCRKAKGQIHEETIRSCRSKEEGVVSAKTPLVKLKLDKDGEIAGYNRRARQDDRLLYEALRARLQAFGGNGEKAFAEPFYKPTSDGKPGAVVKKVWTDTVFNTGVTLDRGAADNGGMVRIDVFEREGKYYCVPVYIKDIYAKHLPDRAISAGKRFDDWVKIDDSFRFLFALFRNDLIYVKAKKPFNLSPNDKEEKQSVSVFEGFFYYRGINISTGAALIITHDNSYSTELGLKTLLKIEKYAVDILGNKYPVKREKRLNTEWDS